MKLYLVTLLLALAGCAASPTIPSVGNNNGAVISCSRITSIYGVGTLIQLDLNAQKTNNTGSVTIDGNDCKTTITLTGPAKAASAP